jgi:hypothetical protein
MVKINSFNFGFIVVDGKQHVCDVLILPDGTVREREGSKVRLDSHRITWSDVEMGNSGLITLMRGEK